MLPAMLWLAWGLASLPAAAGARTRSTPVQQAIRMLSDMRARAEQATQDEEKVFAQYREWVDDRSRELTFQIETSGSAIERLTALIDKTENKVATLGRSIASLEGDINRMEGEKKDATAARNSEHSEFVKIRTDYAESVDALERAIDTMSAQAYDRPQAEQLLQRLAQKTPGMDRVIVALQNGGEEEGTGAPAAAAYASQSDGIVTLMAGLLTKFREELGSAEEAETNRAHSYRLQMLHLGDSVAQSSADLQERSAARTEASAASAKAQGELADAKRELAADQAFLKDTSATFAKKQSAFASNQQTRKDEVEALGKALEILSDPSVAGSYGRHVALAQAVDDRQPSLLQTAAGQRRSAARRRAEELLRRRAGDLSSRTLQSLLANMADNPFSKVIAMVEDLLSRLKQEASAEADHKAWCDQQLKSNKLKREKRSTRAEELAAQLDGLNLRIEDAGKAVEALVREQADLARETKEAAEQREREKTANADAIADAKAGAAAVGRALVVLKEFYAAQSASLLQQGSGQAPEMAEYKGLHGRSQGVLGMLEVIRSDFARLQSTTEAAEKQAVAEYEQFAADAETEKRLKHEREVKLRLEKDADEFQASQTQKDMASNQQTLDAANKYFEDLKPNCLEVRVSFEERAQRRKEEIAALKEAFGILDSKATAAA